MRDRCAILHPLLGRGGSEAAVMWGLEALRHEYDVTLITGSHLDQAEWERLNAFYGTAVPWGSFRSREVCPPLRLPIRRAAGLWGAWFTRQCRRIVKDFDVVINAYNPTDVGRAAIHIVADFSWDQTLLREFDLSGRRGFSILHRAGICRSVYLRVCRRIAPPTGRSPLGRDDLLLANSQWTANLLRRRFSAKQVEVIYPPVVPISSHIPWQDRENGFVCLGRVSPEKQVDVIIDILRRVRARGHDIHLHIAGPVGLDPYGRKIAALCAQHQAWVYPEGTVYGARKSALLAGHRFGIHACPHEAFGIAVAEMASAGCVPFVPLGGGQVEIVTDHRLCYQHVDDAVQKICELLESHDAHKAICRRLLARSEGFSPNRFVERLQASVSQFRSY